MAVRQPGDLTEKQKRLTPCVLFTEVIMCRRRTGNRECGRIAMLSK